MVLRFFLISIVLFSYAAISLAQSPEEALPSDPPEITAPFPEDLPDTQPEDDENEDELDILEDSLQDKKPDYSHLTIEAERKARLADLFARLSKDTDQESANLVAEEIWAIWLDSGSASVNMILRRGTAAEKRRDIDLARRMYDHVTTLQPEYAEGWARSGRLAYSEDDLSRCVVEVTQALILEPRHFYALWTLGNALEKLGKREEALEAYQEAHALYPELKAVKDRVTYLESEIDGEVL